MFRSVCKVGTVAARPLEGGLDRDPPQVDIFFGDDEDIILNPAECKLHKLTTLPKADVVDSICYDTVPSRIF